MNGMARLRRYQPTHVACLRVQVRYNFWRAVRVFSFMDETEICETIKFTIAKSCQYPILITSEISTYFHFKRNANGRALLVLKVENLLWSGLQWHRSCHSNKMTPLATLLAAVFLRTGNFSFKIVYGGIFLLFFLRCLLRSMSVKFK